MEGAVLKVIETFDGSKALKGNCRHIKGDYYEMNRQCFMMPDGKWHRVNNGLIAYDHRANNWKLKTYPLLTEGIVGGVDVNPIMGYFTSTGYESVVSWKGRNVLVMDDSLLSDLCIVEDIGSDKIIISDKTTTQKYVGKKRIYQYKSKLNYNSEDTLEDEIYKFNKEGFRGNLPFYPDELHNITFGFEIETWNGTINNRLLSKVGLIPLLDGSLRHDGLTSYEYATVPLKGSEGLYILKNAFDVLQHYTEISKYCSLHLHIGGYKKSKEFVVSLYKTIKAIEDELYDLFPKYYKDTSQFKEKNYCGPMPNFRLSSNTDEAFERIYRYLSMSEEPFVNFTDENHPADKNNTSKWNVKTRYHLINMTSFLWGKRGTVEFRLHPPTLNPVKAINWLFICNGILRYANMMRDDWNNITKAITLNDMMSLVYDRELSNYLINYMNTLKSMRSIYDSVEDYDGTLWCKEDLKLDFPNQDLLLNLFRPCPLL